MSSEGERGALVRRGDVALIVACVVVLGALDLLRWNYWGDGMRHLPSAIAAGPPPIISSRWLFFPALIWAIERPFALLGLVHDPWQAETVFCFVTMLAGAAYLFALRAWLMAWDVTIGTRCVALLAAASCSPFVKHFSDNIEPTIPAAIVVSGLAFAASRARREQTAAFGALVAVAAISLASLLYQGLALAIAFLPLAVPLPTLLRLLRRPAFVVSALAILAVSPLVCVAALAAGGQPLHAAVVHVANGGESGLYRATVVNFAPHKIVAALLFGAASATVDASLPQGLWANLAGARHGDLGALFQLALLAIGFAIEVALAVVAWRRRSWAWFLALAGMLLLPALRTNQWTYPKFYVLAPVLLALTVTWMRPRAAAVMVALFVVVNVPILVGRVREGRAKHLEYEAFEAANPSGACWVSSGWGPPEEARWRHGTFCGIMREAGLHGGDDGARVRREVAASFSKCLEACFCDGSVVATDTFRSEERSIVRAASDQYCPTVDVDPLLWTPDKAGQVPAQPPGVYVFARGAQREACDRLRAFRADATP